MDIEVQSAGDDFAALPGEHAFFIGEVAEFMSHLFNDFFIGDSTLRSHLGQTALDDVPVFQREERHEEINQVLIDQTCVPETTYRERTTRGYYSRMIFEYNMV